MPLYDFSCDGCGLAFEARTGFEDPAPPCPECGSSETRKVINGFALGAMHRPTGGEAKRLDAKRKGREDLRIERREQRKALREHRRES